MLGRTVLDRYEVIASIGHGSMGQVWLANDRRMPRQVVVKEMREQVAGRPHFREQFQREMEFMARFKHPHAVEYIDATFSDPAPPVGQKVYQVRALQLVTTGSGSFTNLSQGIFVTVN